jgi:prolyl-tRNA synthetase
MKASRCFIPTLRDTPKDATIASHRLMLRAGMIQQISAGIYAWLPLGLRVLQKIETIVRQEQNRIGAQEMLAPTIQPADLWKESGRYDDYGKEMLRIQDRHAYPLLYGPTAEEVLTLLVRTHIKSYKELPQCLYNIQWKFRDEVRPRYGIMRGREFLMKDAYSFDLTPEKARECYGNMFRSYMRTFRRLGIKAIPVRAETGPIGGDLSHEFHIVSQTGEGDLYYDKKLDQMTLESMDDFQDIYAMADDHHNPETCPLDPAQLRTSKGIEVGHIFYFGTKYSRAMNAFVTNDQGQSVPIEMGSYGIGLSRMVGALIEVFHDDKGIRWPMGVAPYSVAIIGIGPNNAGPAEHFYTQCLDATIDAFLYDKDDSVGVALSNMDLLGFPYQVIFGKAFQKDGQVEIKHRQDGTIQHMTTDQALSWLQQHCKENIAL